jgi:CRISPR-associated protein Csm1
VSRLAQDDGAEPGERLYSVYSGGDDLFFVGAWDAVIELARRVRRDLTPYAANHPGIHASAGIALVGGKYPLSQAARDAGAAEEQAKAYRRAGRHTKDAICFLDSVQPWELFGLEEGCAGGFNSVHQLAHLLAEMTEPEEKRRKAAPKSLIRSLLDQYSLYADALEARRKTGDDVSRVGVPQTPWGPWMWRTVYLLTRMAERMKRETLTQAEIKALRDNLWQNNFNNIEWIGLAARWAELLTRES